MSNTKVMSRINEVSVKDVNISRPQPPSQHLTDIYSGDRRCRSCIIVVGSTGEASKTSFNNSKSLFFKNTNNFI